MNKTSLINPSLSIRQNIIFLIKYTIINYFINNDPKLFLQTKLGCYYSVFITESKELLPLSIFRN